MKTTNLQMNLMTFEQLHKEITYNQSLSIIDALLNKSIIDFIDEIPAKLERGNSYIVTSNPSDNKLKAHADNIAVYLEGWHFIKPKGGMIFFVNRYNNFYVFNDKWLHSAINININAVRQKIEEVKNLAPEPLPIPPKLTSPSENFTITHPYHALYLNNNVFIDIANISFPITIAIKQNNQKCFQIKWSDNILWRNKIKPDIAQKPNVVQVYKLYPLFEKDFYLGESNNIIYEY